MNPLHLRLNLSVFIAVLFLFGESLAQRNTLLAQESEPSNISRHIDVFVSENKVVNLEHNVGEITNANPEIVKGEKLQSSDNQFSLVGIKSGEGSVVVRTGNQIINYHVSVGPMPERIYINIPESKRITFTDAIDDVAVSAPGILRIVQPSDNIILLEALRQGKTTVTVTSKGEIYRYFVSTFDNRGADILEIENAFAAKGYRQLHVSFDKDQATVSGSVPTEEELDDAIRIVKQYTPYVIIKAVIGEVGIDPADSEDERVIINNIQRIAQVKGLIVRVQFPRPVETDSNTFTRVVGNPALTNTTVDNQTRLSTTNTTLPADNSQANLQKAPQEGTIESVNIVKNVATPEKIFLFGELATDNDEARAVRVARTFSPQVISFITVKDPMQLRIRMRLLQINFNKLKDVGVLWSDSVSPLNPPAVGFGFHSPNVPGTLNFAPGQNPVSAFNTVQGAVNNSINNILYGISIDANAQIRLLETRSAGRTVYDQSQLLTNGQPGEFFNGQQIPYVSGSTIANGTTQFSTSFVNIGLGVTILPLNYAKAGGAGVPSNRITTTLPKYLPGVPGNVDESLKYVDENGLIGLDITTSLSALDTSLPSAANGFLPLGGGAEAPVTTSRLAVNRALLHDHQSVVAAGLFNDAVTRAVKAVPFFNRIPIFGFLFENPVDNKATFETVIVYTPELVRMSDPDTKRIPKPILPELQQEITKQGLIPLIKPARFDGNAEAITISSSPVVASAVDVNNTPVATPPPAQKTSSSTSKSKKVAAKKPTSTSNAVTTTTTTSSLPLPDNAFVQDVSNNPAPAGTTTSPVTTTITTTTPTTTSPASTTVPPITTTTIVTPGTAAPTTTAVPPVTTTTTTTPGTTAVTTTTPETTTTVVTPTSPLDSTPAPTAPGSVPPLQQFYYYGTESNPETGPQGTSIPNAAANQNGRLKMPSSSEETAPSSNSVTPALPSVDNPNVGENGANPTP